MAPAERHSIDNKFWYDIKNIGKNLLTYLPIANEINLYRKAEEQKENSPEKDSGELTFRRLYCVAGILTTILWFESGINNNAWTPRQIIEHHKQKRIEEIIQKGKEKYIEKEFPTLYERCNNLNDSIEVAKKYGLPIKILEPSFEQKEKAVNKAKLEGRL